MKTHELITRSILALFLSATLLSGNAFYSKKDFVKIDKSILVSRYEVTNKEYREFLNSIKMAEQIENYTKSLYDSGQWIKKFKESYSEPLVNLYHWHPAYDKYPVVNITNEAVNYYCDWLTKKYNSSVKREYKKVIFRLPTELEWSRFAGSVSNSKLPWTGNSPYATDNKTILANIKIKDIKKGQDDYKFDGFIYTSEVGKFKENTLGIFDVIGNVSELTQNGIQKGGNWDSYPEDCTIEKTQNYDLPDPRVGFRVVMEILEE